MLNGESAFNATDRLAKCNTIALDDPKVVCALMHAALGMMHSACSHSEIVPSLILAACSCIPPVQPSVVSVGAWHDKLKWQPATWCAI